MFNQTKKTIRIFTQMIIIFLATVLLRRIELPFSSWSIISDIMVFFFYVISVAYWNVTIRRRILNKNVENLLSIACYIMIFWIFVRTCRFSPIPDVTFRRYCWYSYYIAFLGLPLIGAVSTHYVGKSAAHRLNNSWKIMIIAGFILCLLVYTNDYHQLFFSFSDIQQEHYTYGPGYYLIVGWILALIIHMIACLYQKCRLPDTSARIVLPLIIIAIGVVYSVCFMLPSIHPDEYFEVTATYCALYIALWEACIQVGLISSNTNYDVLFRNATLPLQIVDLQDELYFSSKLASKEILSQDLYDSNYRVNRTHISGGYFLWVENIKEINDQLSKLRRVQQNLKNSNEMIQAEVEAKKRKTHIETQNHLYDYISSVLEDKINELSELIDDEDTFKNHVKEICIKGVYIKRKSNLILLSQNSDYLNCQELELCIRETLNYLKSNGVEYSFLCSTNEELPYGKILYLFDQFERMVESILEDTKNVFVTLKSEESRIKLSVQYDGKPVQLDGIVTTPCQDGAILEVSV